MAKQAGLAAGRPPPHRPAVRRARRRRPSAASGASRARSTASLVRLWPTMFAYQFVYELAVSPALDVPADGDVASTSGAGRPSARARRPPPRPDRHPRRDGAVPPGRLPLAAVGPVRSRRLQHRLLRRAGACVRARAISPSTRRSRVPRASSSTARRTSTTGRLLALVRVPFAIVGAIFGADQWAFGRLTRLSLVARLRGVPAPARSTSSERCSVAPHRTVDGRRRDATNAASSPRRTALFVAMAAVLAGAVPVRLGQRVPRDRDVGGGVRRVGRCRRAAPGRRRRRSATRSSPRRQSSPRR